jgi:hypothetical protein
MPRGVAEMSGMAGDFGHSVPHLANWSRFAALWTVNLDQLGTERPAFGARDEG